jgi:RNA polymerase sigma factor (TIGR02999 family)
MSEQTDLLLAWTRGDRSALDRLLPLVYRELRDLAQAYLNKERGRRTLQPTALVNEVYLRLVGRRKVSLESRHELLALVAQTMRRVLIDHARRGKSAKRRADLKTTLDTAAPELARDQPTDLLDLDRALRRLERLDKRQAQVVELRYFGGYSVAETAEILEVSPITIKRDWAMAKGWLYQQLRGATE